MPKQTQRSTFLGKYADRLKPSYEEYRNEEVEYSSYSDLPGGIENGIARLVDCKIDTVKEGKQSAGEYYFYAAGVVLSPKEHDGAKIEGLRTSVTEMLFDTPGRGRETVEDHFKWVTNLLGQLGIDRTEVDLTDEEQMEQALDHLRTQQPTFRFRTWRGDKEEIEQTPQGWVVTRGGKRVGGPYKTEAILKQKHPYAGREPRTQHFWNGLADYDEPTVPDDDQVDETAAPPAPSRNGPAPRAAVNGAPKPGAPMVKPGQLANKPGAKPTTPARPGMKPKPAPEPEPEPEELDLDGMSLSELAEQADPPVGNEGAIRLLTSKAQEAGLDDDTITSADSWADVVAMMDAAAEGDSDQAADTEEEPAEPEWEPAKEEIYKYQPMDPKTKKPALNAKKKPLLVEVEVTAVDKKGKTVNLKSIDDPKKTWPKVAWTELQSAE